MSERSIPAYGVRQMTERIVALCDDLAAYIVELERAVYEGRVAWDDNCARCLASALKTLRRYA